MIPLRDLLDPRPAAEPPVAAAVWIPAAELEGRVHELPPAGEVLRVADAEDAGLALETLARLERPAALEPRFAYADSPEPGRLWRPNAFLEAWLAAEHATPGSALDIACGGGRDAVFLASLGWSVTGIDWLPDALERGEALRARYAAERAIRWVRQDVEAEPGIAGTFDLVTCFYFLDRNLFGTLGSLLGPGGSVLLETFTAKHRETHGRPNRERFVLELGELPSLVSSLEVVSFDEAWRDGGRHTARLWARRGR